MDVPKHATEVIRIKPAGVVVGLVHDAPRLTVEKEAQFSVPPLVVYPTATQFVVVLQFKESSEDAGLGNATEFQLLPLVELVIATAEIGETDELYPTNTQFKLEVQ